MSRKMILLHGEPTSLLMLWTAPPPARKCHRCALLRLPRFGGANHADGHDNRPRHRKVGFQIYGIDAAGNVIVRALSSATTFCHSPSYRRCNKKLWIDRRCEQPSLTTLIHSQRAWRSATKASHRCTRARGRFFRVAIAPPSATVERSGGGHDDRLGPKRRRQAHLQTRMKSALNPQET